MFRLKERLIHPHLWAEDGVLFLLGGLQKGLLGLFEPYGGYYHSVSKILSYGLIQLFDLTWFPVATIILCLGLTSFIYSTVTLSAYRWLLPSDGVRILTAILLCLTPGSSEVLGNFTNLHWILYFYLWLLAMKPAEKSFSIPEVLCAFLICFSTGEVVVLLPLFLWRIYQQRRGGSKRLLPSSRSDIAIVITLVFSTLLNVVQREGGGPGVVHQFDAIGHALMTTVSQQMIYFPWMGQEVLNTWSRLMNRWYYYLWAFVILGILIKQILYMDKQSGWTFLLGLSCALGVPMLTFVVRPDSAHVYARVKLNFIDDMNFRYYFVMAPFAVLLWSVGIQGLARNNRFYWIFASLFGVAYISGSRNDFYISPLGLDRMWVQDVVPLISSVKTGCPKQAVVPIYPNGWVIDYHSKFENICP